MGKINKIITLTIVITMFSFVQVSNAAVRAGDTCSKIGITSKIGNKTYTCIKSKNKLVWNNGIPIKSTKPTSASYPNIPTSFSNLYANRNGIAYGAWKSTADSISTGNSKLRNSKLFVGPNTIPPVYNTPEIAYGLVSKAFSNYEVPNNVILIEYSFKDISWAEGKVKEYVTYSEFEQLNQEDNGKLLTSHCGLDECSGAKQFSAPGIDGTAFILIGVPNKIYIDPIYASKYNIGQLEAHEFFHSLQRRNVVGTQFKDWPVSWIVEGGAALVQNLALSSSSYEKYIEWRKIDSLNMIGVNSPVNSEFMSSFLDIEQNKDYWRSVDRIYAYNLGSRVMEILVALKGPSVLLDLHKETALYGFELAFQKIFGTTWKIASVEITRSIVDSLREGN